jgi:PAS domain S-box-containing protein
LKKIKIFMMMVAALVVLSTAMSVSADGQLRIVYNVGVAPLKFEDADSRPAGLFPDLWRLWAQKTGKQIKFVRAKSFQESLQLLKDGHVDLHAGLFKTPAREKFLDYSQPLLTIDYFLFTHPSVHPIKSLDKTAGLLVGVQKGGYTEQFVRAGVPPTRIVVYDRFQDLFRAALEGEIKVFVASRLSLFYYLKENWLTNIFEYAKDRPLFSRVYYTATAKTNSALIQQVNEGLNAISRRENAKLEDKWILRNFRDIAEEPAGAQSAGQGLSLTDAEIKWLRQHPIIRIHNEKDWPPFNYFEYGTPRGLSIDYMNLVSEQLGIKVEYITGPSWNQFLGMIKRKELDVMLNIVKTKDRMQYLLFTEPYIKNPNVIVSLQERPYGTVQALDGKTVAFPKGFFYEEVLTRSFPGIKRLPVTDTLASLKAVMFGRADAALGESAVIRTLLNKNLLSGLRVSGEVNIGNPDLMNLRLGVRKDWPLLHSALMKAMAAIGPRQMDQIRQKWIRIAVPAHPHKTVAPAFYGRLIAYAVVVFVILSLLAWILIRTLHKGHISIYSGSRWFRGFVLAGLSLFVILVCLLGWFALKSNKEKIIAGISDKLVDNLKTANDRLDLWMAQRSAFMELMGRNPELVQLTRSLLAVPPDRQDLVASDALRAVRSFFKNNREIFSHLGFFIINPDQISIGSMRDSNLGNRNFIAVQKPDLLRQAFAGKVRFVPPIQSDVILPGSGFQAAGSGNFSTMFFIGPIRNQDGQTIAVVALRVDPSRSFSRLLPFSAARMTGETYAFDQYGKMLSESRFDDQLHRLGLIQKDQSSASNLEIRDPGVNLVKGRHPASERSRQPLTHMALRALELKRGMEKAGRNYGHSKIEVNAAGYRDYRGVPVFGAWLWNLELGIGLAAEVDMAEALSSYYHIRWTILGVLGITLFISVGAVLMVLVLGERTSRALMKARDSLEEKVAERTAELTKNQQQLEAAEERSRLLLDSAGEGIFGVDVDGKIVFINPSANRMLDYEPGELIGQDIHWQVHHSYPDGSMYPKEKCPMYLTHADGSEQHIVGEVLWRKDGSSFFTEYTSMPIKKEDRVVGAVISFMDITERRQMEKELLEAKEKAEEATRAKSDFLANMSHEIRTPMNAVIGMAHLALKTELTPKQQDYLSKIQSSANSLLGIINDILDFSKIEAGKLDMETVVFDLSETMDNVANVISIKAREKENLEVLFDIDAGVPNFLSGDPLRLNQILVNLGNNAVKFTEQGEIVFTVKQIRRSDHGIHLEFSVRDTGIGMTMEQQGRLFQAFSQADTSTTRKYGGTGLGLTISKRLVTMMGGEIWVDSEPGRGTTFSFTANFGLVEEKAKKQFSPSPDLRGIKVLVVDDNATSRQIFHDMLVSSSFEVYLAASGAEALDEIERADEKTPFELVIMDWKMPDMDGLEASRRIKNHEKLHKIPAVILVTAYGREELMHQAEKIGLEGFLLKPVSASVLFDAMMQALGREALATSRAEHRKNERLAGKMQDLRGARVLLVEDNEINQQVAREILEDAGLVITIANNGKEGLERVKSSQFEAVLMDVQMPVMDGYEATRRIRKWEDERGNSEVGMRNAEGGKDYDLKPESKRLPVIAMTAHAMAGDKQKSLVAGMNDHITKPIDPEQLFAALRKWIKADAKKAPDRVPRASHENSRKNPVAGNQELLPEFLPGFDLQAGLKRLQGNQKLYRKLLLDFGANYGGVAGEIYTALKTGDFQQAHSLIHNLKGLAGNLEATDVRTATVEIERIVKGQTANTVSIKELEQKYARLEAALGAALEAVGQLGPAVEKKSAKNHDNQMTGMPSGLTKGVAGRIREAAEMGDVSQITEIAGELKGESGSMASLGDELIRLAEDFDFEGIQSVVDKLSG